MSVLRRDPTTGRWVVFAEASGPVHRPGDPCPFCEGNEVLTPPEIAVWGREGGARNGPGWKVRVVANAQPLLRIEGSLERRADLMYDAESGTGAHEIVIETPEHRKSLAELSAEQVALVLQAYAARMKDLKRDSRIRSIFVFKNQGVRAGAGMPGHAHSQVIGLPITPKVLKELLQDARSHFQLKERCVFCDILRVETQAEVRLIRETDHFVVLAPYASRYPFESWIIPREHSPDYETTSSEALRDLADVLLQLLTRLERILPEPAYNMFLYSGPNRSAQPLRWTTLAHDFHWHVEILPRVGEVAGFEVGSGFYANPVMPEQAAAALRTTG
jgi:UDPglucose--hexose-1-phosphate uridylyltransferase